MQNREQIALRVSLVSILVNLLLTAAKLAAGLLARSGAMVSDAVHSASDVCSTLVVMVGVRLSAKASDREHPYGHERLECVAAILSIAVKEAMFWYTRRRARQTDSDALMADAWHHRSDALSSVGALLGIAGARLGFPILDPLASVVICIFIGKAAADIFLDAVNKMIDRSCSEETEQAIRACVLAHGDVSGVDLLLTREFGSRIYAELEISVDGDLSLRQAHAVAERVHNDVEAAFPKVKHIMIHVNPA